MPCRSLTVTETRMKKKTKSKNEVAKAHRVKNKCFGSKIASEVQKKKVKSRNNMHFIDLLLVKQRPRDDDDDNDDGGKK